jgi:hypothetical protein
MATRPGGRLDIGQADVVEYIRVFRDAGFLHSVMRCGPHGELSHAIYPQQFGNDY